MKKYPVISRLNAGDRVMYGGLMGLSLVCLTILASQVQIEGAIAVSVYCFAVAIPCLAFCTERVRIDAQHQWRTHSTWIDLVEAGGIYGAMIGFGAVFWHLSVPAALVFGLVCLGALSLHSWYGNAMEKVNAEDEPVDEQASEDHG